jgi:pimeloyl-ACP methyl ester carboxylesterase
MERRALYKILLKSLAAWLVLVLLGVGGFLYLNLGYRTQKVEAAAGFRSPYYLYLPRAVNSPVHLLVAPNNTGKPDDDPRVHERAAWLRVLKYKAIADQLGTPMLIPAFPRERANWRVYTHALDRDSLTTTLPGLQRPDLQLIAMVEDAQKRLQRDHADIHPHVLIMGFSASGMFANRFALLHPEKVLASAAGSPGGWPLAPLHDWEGRRLRYPVGVADLRELTGSEFQAAEFQKVAQFIYVGDKDDNDSVVFEDGYDPQDRETIETLFGKDLQVRWEASKNVYADVKTTKFRRYPGAAHGNNKEMQADVVKFFRDAVARE